MSRTRTSSVPLVDEAMIAVRSFAKAVSGLQRVNVAWDEFVAALPPPSSTIASKACPALMMAWLTADEARLSASALALQLLENGETSTAAGEALAFAEWAADRLEAACRRVLRVGEVIGYLERDGIRGGHYARRASDRMPAIADAEADAVEALRRLAKRLTN